MPEQKITVKNDNEIKSIYSNFVSINSSTMECNLTFCYIDPSKNTPPNVEAQAVAKIILPIQIYRNLIETMKSNYDKMQKDVENEK
jgi:hypothetical protein